MTGDHFYQTDHIMEKSN